MMKMQDLQWPLAVLSRAVHYKNLTGASQHVGLSQPQLSRIIAKIEEELKITLLDRSSRRKAVWTQAALQLAQVYEQSNRKLLNSIHELQMDSQPTQIHIGTLEGLLPLANQYAKLILQKTTTHFVQLDVFDQDDIEAQFIGGEVDVIFTSRVPGKSKPKFLIELGHQEFIHYQNNDSYCVYSPYEYVQHKQKAHKNKKILVSNSLAARRLWLEKYGGSGQIPGDIHKKNKKSLSPVLLIANDWLNPLLWQQTQALDILIKKDIS